MASITRSWLAGLGALAAAGAAAFGPVSGASAAFQDNAGSRAASVPGSVYVPATRTLTLGMHGPDVRALQLRLNFLHYYAGKANGWFGISTLEAVWAFKEVQAGRWKPGNPDIVGPLMQRELRNPKLPKVLLHNPPRNWVQVNKAEEVLVVYQFHTTIKLISHISTANFIAYGGGWITPNGSYHAWEYIPGPVADATFGGFMYNPVFFIGTSFAIHGMPNPTNPPYGLFGVPLNPASHGCVRIPMDVSWILHKFIRVKPSGGSLVFVTGPATLSF